ncbi:MAG: bifunctional adenosylcobinamide kinase/adenosylcobinamide-phosphate guanylyltransferase [Desulfobacterales bacterium]|nr:bifunctional adenosylcobinamide kinase/adenosylcobinamide-phosphate guanylyltransferase [Desulfobacterales bacterium]
MPKNPPDRHLLRLQARRAGIVNQNIAACSDRVIWMVAGIAVPIKESV